VEVKAHCEERVAYLKVNNRILKKTALQQLISQWAAV